MHLFTSALLALASVAVTVPAAAEAIFYERAGFQGRSVEVNNQVARFDRIGFNNRSSSVVVIGARWEVCQNPNFQGPCVVLRPGRYPSLAAMGLNNRISSARTVARGDDDRDLPPPGPVPRPVPQQEQATFYEFRGFAGRSFSTTGAIAAFVRYGFNDHASSAVVMGGSWEVCDAPRYRGLCVVLRPGRYPSLAAMGLNNRISSARPVDRSSRVEDERYAPPPAAVYDSRPRDGERLYEAEVLSARAVMSTPSQQCWVERERLPAQNNPNVPGALAGAVIGGILGHQVGGGSGKDIATVSGVIVGAVLGANAEGRPATRDVERCRDVPGSAQPAFWDVSYTFRGQEHRVQMSSAPGRYITVNEQGEPRE